jgi:hypothetical protein
MEANIAPTLSAPQSSGLVAGLVACVLAVLGILFIGFVFVPLAGIVALIGSIKAVRARHLSGIGANALAWVLVLVGFFTSPVLVGMIGLAGMASAGGF